MVPKAAGAAALVVSTRFISPRGAFLAKRSVVLPPARVAASNKNDNTLSSDNDGAEDDTKNDAKKKKKKKKIVVVGAGWGGWGAAKAVAESETASVVLLDGVPDPTGRTGTRATSGKPFEAGVRGFWKDYPNINHLVVRERRRRIAEVLLSSKSRRRHFFLFRLSVSLSLSCISDSISSLFPRVR